MISLISSLSLKFYFNSLVYHRKHLRVFLESPRQSSEIFGHLRKRSSCLRNSFEISSEIFGRWSEIFGKSSKTPSSACLHNKKNIARQLEDMNFIFSWQKTIFYSLAALVRKIKFISSRRRVISSM